LAWADDVDRVTADIILEAARDLPRAAKSATVQATGTSRPMPKNETNLSWTFGQAEGAGD
jgi:hypothetical protein